MDSSDNIIVNENRIVDKNTRQLYPNPNFRRRSLLDQHPMRLGLWYSLLGPRQLPLYAPEQEPFHTLKRIHSLPELYPGLRNFPPDYFPGFRVQDQMLFNMARRNNVPYSLYSQPHFLYAIRETPNSDYATLFVTFYHRADPSDLRRHRTYSFTESILACPRRYMWTFHILNKKIRWYTKAFSGNDELFWIPTLELKKSDGSLHKGSLTVLLGYLLLLRENFVSELWEASRSDMVPSDWRCHAFDEYTLRDMLYVELHTLEDRKRVMRLFPKGLGPATMSKYMQLLQKHADKEMSIYNQNHLSWSDGYLGEEPLYTAELSNFRNIEIASLLQGVYNKDVPSTEQLLFTLFRLRRRLPQKKVYVEIPRLGLSVLYNMGKTE